MVNDEAKVVKNVFFSKIVPNIFFRDAEKLYICSPKN